MFFVSALSVALGFILTVIVARGLGPEGKGSYDLMLASATLLSTVLGLSIAGGVTYAVARRIATAGALLGSLTKVALVQAFVAALILGLVLQTPMASAFIPSAVGGQAIVPIVALVAFTLLASYLRGILLGRSKLVAANWCDLATRIFTVCLVALGVLAVAAGISLDPPVFLIWLCAVATVAGAGIALVLARQDIEAGGSANLAAVLRFAIPQHGVTVGFFLNYRLDLFLVGYLLGPRDVGLYALSSTLAQLLLLFPNAAATVVLPRVASGSFGAADGLNVAATFSRVAFGTSIVAAVVFSLTAQLFVSAVYGDGFEDSVMPLLILLPGAVALGPVKVLVSYVAGSGRPHLNLVSSVLSLIVTVALDLLLIPRFGIVGAAIASSVSYATLAVLTVMTVRRLAPVSIGEVLRPSLHDAREVVAAIRSRKPTP